MVETPPRPPRLSAERVPARHRDPSSPQGHAHRWRGLAFFFRDDHPWFRMTCECGAARDIRAWERYWDPDGGTRA